MLNRRLLIANSQQGGGYVTDGLVFHTDGIENYEQQDVVDLCNNYVPLISNVTINNGYTNINSGYISIKVTGVVNTNSAYTLSMTFKRNTTGNSDFYPFGIYPTSGADGRGNYGYYSDFTKLRCWRVGIDTCYAEGVGIADMATPHCVDIVSDGSAVKLYVDGVYYSQGSVTTAYTGEWRINFGHWRSLGGGNNVDCYSAKVYNRALSADEIAQNYQVDKGRFNI